MRKMISVAVAAMAMASLSQPALAQKKGEEKGPTYKFSKKVQPLLAKAQDAQSKGDAAGALAALNEARAIPDRNDDDNYMIAMMTLNAAILSKDNAQIESALEGALQSNRLSAEDRGKFIRNLGALALQRNDYAKATQYFEQSLAANPNDTQLQVEVAELQRRQGQNQKAVQSIQAAIATQEKATGQKADEAWYRRALAISYDAKLAPEIISSGEALVKAYPSPTNWRDVLVIYRDSAKYDDQMNLDIMRLMRANSALTGERDYAEFAETAALKGFPGESKAVMDEGIAKGAIKSTAPWVKDIMTSVGPKVASDQKSLPGLEKESAAAKDGKLAFGTADAYLGYGDWAKAAAMYKLALSKGGVDTAAANLRMGYALGKAGDKAGAQAAFDAVNAPPRGQLARYYKIWLGNQG